MRRSLLQGACCFIFFASYTARQLVGISVGIGDNRRQNLLQIQMVMALGGYRPGAPKDYFPSDVFHLSKCGLTTDKSTTDSFYRSDSPRSRLVHRRRTCVD